MKKFVCYLLILLSSAFLSACGGGGSNTSAPSRTLKSVIKPTALTAVMNVATIQLSITVPLGVSPLLPEGKTELIDAIEIINSTDHVVNNKTLKSVTYTAATSATVPGQITVGVVQADGFKEADEITIHMKVDTGAFPKESDFTLLSFDAHDTAGATLALDPALTTTLLY